MGSTSDCMYNTKHTDTIHIQEESPHTAHTVELIMSIYTFNFRLQIFSQRESVRTVDYHPFGFRVASLTQMESGRTFNRHPFRSSVRPQH